MPLDEQHLEMAKYLHDNGFVVSEDLAPKDVKYMYDQIFGSISARASRLPPNSQDCFGAYIGLAEASLGWKGSADVEPDTAQAMSASCYFPDGSRCALVRSCVRVTEIQTRAEKLRAKQAKKDGKTPPAGTPPTPQPQSSDQAPPKTRKKRKKDVFGFVEGSIHSVLMASLFEFTDARGMSFSKAVAEFAEKMNQKIKDVKEAFSKAKFLMKKRGYEVDIDDHDRLSIICPQK